MAKAPKTKTGSATKPNTKPAAAKKPARKGKTAAAKPAKPKLTPAHALMMQGPSVAVRITKPLNGDQFPDPIEGRYSVTSGPVDDGAVIMQTGARCMVPAGLSITITVTKRDDKSFRVSGRASPTCVDDTTGTWRFRRPTGLKPKQKDYIIQAVAQYPSATDDKDTKTGIET